jgi:hypothetical protein
MSDHETAPVISFRGTHELKAAIARQAQAEGLTASAVVRRAAMRDLAAQADAGRAT